MTLYLWPALFALFVWWASTVLIIYLDNLPRKTFGWSMAGATVVFAVSLWGLAASARDPSPAGAYWAFTWGLLAWGWQEMSFYMGYVTGPRKAACREDCGGWRHFGHAVQTSLWHELAIIVAAGGVVALTWGSPNQVGTWTFMVLWWMHQSAKLNVFFGVRNLNEEFLPAHLEFLKSFLRKRSMNLLFPVSVTVSTVITVLLAKAALAADATAFDRAGFTFLTVLMALAILEHWMLVLPMPAGAIWQPGLRSRGAQKPFAAEIVVGFLGAGKTTFLQRLLKEADPKERTVVLVNDFGALGAGKTTFLQRLLKEADPKQRTVVLVNDFGALGLDGTLLQGQGADVVELANGCICCSLRSDLSAQLKDTVARLKPDRVLIEPSGVADVASLLRVLHQPDIAPLVASRRLYTVIDAGAFPADYARMPDYFDVQTRLAPVFILNKTDLVTPAALRMIIETLRALNPAATVLPARYGVTEAGALRDVGRLSSTIAQPQAETGHAELPALGLASWSAMLPEKIDLARLETFLASAAAGTFGTVARIKGLAQSGDGWIRFDLAGGRASTSAHRPGDAEQARALVIGDRLDAELLAAALAECSERRPESKAPGLRSWRPGLVPLACGCPDHASGFCCADVGVVAAE